MVDRALQCPAQQGTHPCRFRAQARQLCVGCSDFAALDGLEHLGHLAERGYHAAAAPWLDAAPARFGNRAERIVYVVRDLDLVGHAYTKKAKSGVLPRPIWHLLYSIVAGYFLLMRLMRLRDAFVGLYSVYVVPGRYTVTVPLLLFVIRFALVFTFLLFYCALV